MVRLRLAWTTKVTLCLKRKQRKKVRKEGRKRKIKKRKIKEKQKQKKEQQKNVKITTYSLYSEAKLSKRLDRYLSNSLKLH